MRKWISLCLTVLLCISLCSCGIAAKKEESGDVHQIYFAADYEQNCGGDVIQSIDVDWADMEEQPMENQVRYVLTKLMEDPQVEGLASALPRGVNINEIRVNGTSVEINFSGQYAQLSGMELTIANSCVTLSLTDLNGINLVRILVNGRVIDYWSSNVFMANDMLLSSTEDVVRSMVAKLYFIDEFGALQYEERVLTIMEGETQSQVIMNGLKSGPVSETLRAVLPEDFVILGTRVDDGICYVNLSQESEILVADTGIMAIRSIVRSLCSQSSIQKVQFLVDGEIVPMFAGVDISMPLNLT